MKIGDYVRTGRGIAKIIEITKTVEDKIICVQVDKEIGLDAGGNEFDVIPKRDIIKSSLNIIDLIEVGDIVKIEYEGWKQVMTKFEVLKFYDVNGDEFLYDEIEAIITKEQLESIEYKVGSVDNENR